jgi:sigma-B regulation protein RsbU (phosphoserine phosphatase)
MPSLILIKSPGGLTSGQTYSLAGDALVIGREDGCGLTIPNNSVSRRHAQIVRANGQYILEDLKSRNKTFLNNQEVVGPTPLRTDDRIKICDYLFRFQDERSTATGPKLAAPAPFAPPADDDGDEEPAVTVQSTQVIKGAARQLLDVQPADMLRALLEISTNLSRTLDLDTLLPQIADTLFGVFRQADRCFIILLDEGGRLIPRAVKSRRGKSDDQRFSKTIVRKCLESMQAYLSEDASADSNLGAAMSIAAIQIRSAMCVPLATADGKPLGAMQLDTHDFMKKFRAEDLKLLTIVANFASVAVEKAQVHNALILQEKQQQEIEIAKKVQLGFLPQFCPEVDGYEFFAFYSAAQTVGGDYYDFIEMPGGRMAVVLGDVAGKGVPAALLMAKLSAEARFCLLTQPDIGVAIRLLNDQLIRGGIGDRFVTLAVAVLDPAAHTVTVVNAGHINPNRLNMLSGVLSDAVSDDESGLPLGLMPGYPYEAKVVPVGPNDSVVLYTDGVTDAMNPAGAMFGTDGVRAALAGDDMLFAEVRPKAAGERLVQQVKGHANGRAQNDDIAVVCFGRVESSGQITGINPRPAELGPGSGGTTISNTRR